MPDFGKKKKPGRVATGSAGGSKKAENNRVANAVVTFATACAPALGRAFAPVMMTSGAAHDGGSPNSTAGGFDASQTSGHVANSNARRFPFNTSCDRALSTDAMPEASTTLASQGVAKAGGRTTRRDRAAAAAALATQRSVDTQRVAFNAGCCPATIASLSSTAGASSMEEYLLSNKGYLKRSTWTVGRPPSYTVPLIYISTQLK
jgi:hypothetical protein